MTKEEFKKADKIVKDTLKEVTESLETLLDKQEDRHKLFVMEGAFHAMIHILEEHAPSGLYSTQFIVGALNDTLLAQIHSDCDEDEEVSDDRVGVNDVVH